jgi:3'(2'), 5'-bisphosphate nucleotidase
VPRGFAFRAPFCDLFSRRSPFAAIPSCNRQHQEPHRVALTGIDLEPRLIEELTALVSHAAAAVMRIRATTISVRQKADASPVTAADEVSEDIIAEGLRRLMPGLDVISEEAAAHTAPQSAARAFALVDPLDGTREFIAGRDEFTINLAIVANGRPVFGLVSAPALHCIWRGVAARGAERLQLAPGALPHDARERTAIHTAPPREDCLRALASRSHLDADTAAWLVRHPGADIISCGSAVKFCRIAEGSADVYPRLAPTMEWDVAAGDAVLTAAGGAVLTPDGEPLTYGRIDRDLRIPAFIAWGRAPNLAS